MKLQAIETTYHGYKCRSRLEARWIVFFEAMKYRFEYEPEGFEFHTSFPLHLREVFKGYTPKPTRYLPDFWLPQVEMWAEVKPCKFNAAELAKVEMLVEMTGFPCLMLVGPPDFYEYEAVEFGYPFWDDSEPATKTHWVTQYKLSSEYVESERRFFHQGCWEGEENKECFGDDYIAAVYAARAARFDSKTR